MNIENIKKLINHSSAAAASKAKAELINDLFQQNQKDVYLGLAKALPDDHASFLKDLQRNAIAEHKQASIEAYRLDIQLQAEAAAKVAGSVNPELTAQVIAQQARIERDASGELYFVIKDISSGVEMDIPFALERLSRNQDYSVLFNEPIQQSQKTGNIPSDGNTEVNPWKKENFNLTFQGNILLSEPERAARLKREAGLN